MTPLIFFVHVPKTAGSTVNAVLKERLPNGRDHVQAILNDDQKFKRAVNNLDWMSGHVNRDEIETRIRKFTTRPVRFFACVRHATAHQASHYNWLFFQGRKFEKNTHFNKIYSSIKNNGFTPGGVIKTLSEFPDLLNYQTYHLIGRSFDGHETDFRAALARRFELVTIDPDEALSAMLGQRTITLRRENEASYGFDPAIFYDNKVLDFLAEGNRKDEIIYRVVSTLAAYRGNAD